LFQKTDDNQYLRFQPELDKVYSLDDYQNIPSLVETVHIFIENLKNSDDNKFNNLIESLDINNKFIFKNFLFNNLIELVTWFIILKTNFII
jgi:hypothetical protein